MSIGLLIHHCVAAPIALQPHRAYYSISMCGHPRPQGTVADIRGTMMIEVNKVSGGWTVQQLSEIWRYPNNEPVEHIRWGYVTWEAEDGSMFKFNTFRKVNNELVEDIRGTAKRQGKLTRAFFQKPEQTTLQLPEGTLFPLQHTLKILAAALAGEHTLPSIVFDGSNLQGVSEINTFIGAKKVIAEKATNQETHQFANQPVWPVRSAVYGLKERAYEPNYITTQYILSNGIITQFHILDQEDIEICADLQRIELLEGGSS